MPYEKLLNEALQHDIYITEEPMESRVKGLYGDNVIWINENINTSVEKACVLAEELGHHHTSVGDIIAQTKLTNRKQEKLARSWAYKKLVPLDKIVKALISGIKNTHELADSLEVTESFLQAALIRYKEEYGLYATIGKHTIYFEPLGLLEMFDE